MIFFLFIFSINNIDSDDTSFLSNWWQYTSVILIGVILYIGVYFYLKNIHKHKNNEQILTFLKVLLPTTLAILSLLYALSSGFFSLQKENLKFEKNQLTLEKDSIRDEIKSLGTSIDELKKEKDSILTQVKLFKNDKDSITFELIKAQEKLARIEPEYRKLSSKNMIDINSGIVRGLIDNIGAFKIIRNIKNIDLSGSKILFDFKKNNGQNFSDKELELKVGIDDIKSLGNYDYIKPKYIPSLKKFEYEIPKKYLNNRSLFNDSELLITIKNKNLIPMDSENKPTVSRTYHISLNPLISCEYLIYINI